MNISAIPAQRSILIGFTIGVLLGRLWEGTLANVILGLVVLLAVCAVVVTMSFRRRGGESPEYLASFCIEDIQLTTLFFVSMAIGGWLGRVWTGDLADVVLSLVALWTIGFYSVAAISGFLSNRMQRRVDETRASPVEPTRQALPASEREIVLATTEWFTRFAYWLWTVFFDLRQAVQRRSYRGSRLGVSRATPTDYTWLAFALALYAFTRLFALDQFPINFFADEANQVMNAVDLVKRGFRDPQGEWFPVYIQLFSYYYPDISIYFHAITTSLFGVSIEVARATCGIVTLLAVGAAGLMLKQIFRARFWWAVVLLMAMTPIWLLWSRTAFDPVAGASLYPLFIVSYLFYRYRSPHYIYPTLILGAATFYAYPSDQPAIGLLALFLLISDWRYHWQQRRMLRWAVPLLLLLVIPLVRYLLMHSEEATTHLRAANSFWALNIPVTEKLVRSAVIYLQVLSPTYWFLPNQPDLIRHVMKGYGFLPLIELPLFVIGVILCLRYFKESKYRAVLAALLAAPVGATVTDPAIIRELSFVIPATIVSVLGLEWLCTRIKSARVVVATHFALFVILSALSLSLLQDALANGPTWFSDYTLYGMQWGAKQVFRDTVPRLIQDNPNAPIFVSDTWANGTGVFVYFFALNPNQVVVRNIAAWLEKKVPLAPNTIFVMTPDEYEKARASSKFKNVVARGTIPYPDGRDGFFIVRLEYADNVDAVFAAERAALLQPVTESVNVGGEMVQLTHTKFDMGIAQSMFDGDLYTVARGVESNPCVLDFKFAQPRTVRGLSANLGKSNVRVVARLYASEMAPPVEYTFTFRFASATTELPAGPVAEMNFDGAPDTITRLYLEIGYPETDDTAHAHVFELKLR
jgi:hypothetical protein